MLGLYKVFGFTWNMRRGRWSNSCLWCAMFVYFDLYAPNSYGCIGEVFPLSPHSLMFCSAICDLSSCKALSFILQNFIFYLARLLFLFFKTLSFILQDFIFHFANLYLLFNKLYSFGFAKLSFLYWKPDVLCSNSIPFIILSTISYFAISLYWYCESCSFVLQDLIFLLAKVYLLPSSCFLFLLEL